MQWFQLKAIAIASFPGFPTFFHTASDEKLGMRLLLLCKCTGLTQLPLKICTLLLSRDYTCTCVSLPVSWTLLLWWFGFDPLGWIQSNSVPNPALCWEVICEEAYQGNQQRTQTDQREKVHVCVCVCWYMWQSQHYFFMFFGLQAIITLPTKVTNGSNVVCSNFNLSSKHTTTLGL